MGSRIGYCIEKESKRSGILRKQWMTSIKDGTEKMWFFMGGKPDSRMHPLRNDLDIGRGFFAMVNCFGDSNFNSIEEDTHCDISDNGLITINIDDYKNWKVYHTEIGDFYSNKNEKLRAKGENDIKYDWDKELKETKRLIATMNVEGFKWEISEEELNELGEGLY